MDSVEPTPRREGLRSKIADAQAALRHAATAASIKNDPLRQHLNALDMFVGLQGDIYEANEDTRRQIAELLRSQTDITAKRAVAEALHAEGVSIVNQLVPRLTGPTERTMRQTLQTLRLQSIFWVAIALVAVIGSSNMFTYAAGLNNGQRQGEDSAHAINIAMSDAPSSAMIWAKLMTDNDPGPEMAICQKSISTNFQGRRSCSMPVWIDPVLNQPSQ